MISAAPQLVRSGLPVIRPVLSEIGLQSGDMFPIMNEDLRFRVICRASASQFIGSLAINCAIHYHNIRSATSAPDRIACSTEDPHRVSDASESHEHAKEWDRRIRLLKSW
jgi:hypothetical protein